MKFAILFVLCAGILLLSCSENVSNSDPLPQDDLSETAWYVESSSDGTGTHDSPLGTLQEAFDSAAISAGIDTIFVAPGLYLESGLQISSGVVVLGSRDSEAGWEYSSTDTTILQTGLINGSDLAVGVRIIDSDSLVQISDLSIQSIAADGVGSSAYSVYVLNSDDVILSNCQIAVGNGADGTSGTDGLDGQDGASGSSSNYGVSPVPGGAGGYGGLCPHPAYGGDGSPGGMYLASAAGGPGGQGVDDQAHNASDGADGITGAHGTDGDGGLGTIAFEQTSGLYLVLAGDGNAGTNGTHGSGGGGGGGLGTDLDFIFCTDGVRGAGGGAGAAPGTGGLAGSGGGSSIAVAIYNSTLGISHCQINTMDGGSGGTGGAGGYGGSGGPGGQGECTGLSCAGDGGNGGHGGHAGHGGGGAGGHSIGILNYGSTVTQDSCLFQIGSAGIGGTSDGNPGQEGIDTTYFVVD